MFEEFDCQVCRRNLTSLTRAFGCPTKQLITNIGDIICTLPCVRFSFNNVFGYLGFGFRLGHNRIPPYFCGYMVIGTNHRMLTNGFCPVNYNSNFSDWSSDIHGKFWPVYACVRVEASFRYSNQLYYVLLARYFHDCCGIPSISGILYV